MTAHLRVSRCYPTGRLTFCLPEAKSANRNLGDSFLLVSAMTLWIHNSQTCLFLGRSNCSHYLSEWTEGFYLNFQRWHADGLCGQTKGLYSANHKNVFHNATKFVYLPPHLHESLTLDLLICLLAVVLLMGQQFYFLLTFLSSKESSLCVHIYL